jgi:hypothetical protein
MSINCNSRRNGKKLGTSILLDVSQKDIEILDRWITKMEWK